MWILWKVRNFCSRECDSLKDNPGRSPTDNSYGFNLPARPRVRSSSDSDMSNISSSSESANGRLVQSI